jgi:hypothetical protein
VLLALRNNWFWKNPSLIIRRDECATQGLDWEEVLEQRAREQAKMRELGLNIEPAQVIPLSPKAGSSVERPISKRIFDAFVSFTGSIQPRPGPIHLQRHQSALF